MQDFYEYKAVDLRGNEVSMEKYRGKVVLIVNVASLCGLTDANYKQLAEIYDRLHDQGLEILAFPCNQFGSQEPGKADAIEETCGRYKVKFDLFDKIDVNGDQAHPIYVWLKASLAGTITDSVKWNFTKFLLDRDGKPFKRYSPTDEPKTFEEDIKSLLAKAPTATPQEPEAKQAE